MKYMVFDVGGTAIKYSVMDEKLQRFSEGEVATPQDTKEHFYRVLEEIYLPHKEETAGVAVSMPGFIDIEKGFVDFPGALAYNSGQMVGPELSGRFGCPVHIANDGKCAAVAEYWRGELRGCRTGAVMILGTGIGGGMIVNGQLVNGIHFTAGEFSFLQTNPSDWNSVQGIFAWNSSTRALLERYKEAKGIPQEKPMNGYEFFALYHAGDPDARAVLDRMAFTAAAQIYNMSVVLDLETVAIGGGISRQDVVIEILREKVAEVYASGPNFMCDYRLRAPRIVRCHFGSEANQVGALYLYLKAEGMPLA